jgi:hypothetical protein
MYPDIPEMAVLSNFSGAALATVSPLIPAYILALGANWVPKIGRSSYRFYSAATTTSGGPRGVTTGPRRPMPRHDGGQGDVFSQGCDRMLGGTGTVAAYHETRDPIFRAIVAFIVIIAFVAAYFAYR